MGVNCQPLCSRFDPKRHYIILQSCFQVTFGKISGSITKLLKATANILSTATKLKELLDNVMYLSLIGALRLDE
jgi:hypothetical protein